MKKPIKIFVYLTIYLVFLSFLPPALPIKGQSYDLQISPPLWEAISKPGQAITQTYTIINEASDCQLYVYLTAMTPGGNFGQTSFNPQRQVEEPLEIESWFSFNNPDIKLPGGFNLPAGESQTLNLAIKVPLETKESDYYLALVFQTQPPELKDATGINVQTIITSNILLTVSNDYKKLINGSIKTFIPQPTKTSQIFSQLFPAFNIPIYDSYDKITFDLLVSNNGQAYFKPQGSIKILGPSGKQLGFIPLLEENILAGYDRQLFRSDQTNKSIKSALTYIPHPLSVGQYQAETSLTLPNLGKINGQTNFYLFPLKIILTVLMTAILIPLGLKIKKRFKPTK